jgi:CzcA family heavy metal efflux pump
MLNAIIKYSLKNRLLMVAIAAFIVVYGSIAFLNLPVDVFPDLNRPTVNVLTVVEGMAPEEIEVVVTRPVEMALNGTQGVTKLYSSSVTGLSVVRVEFNWGTDLRFARLAVSERLQLAKTHLPEHISPILSPTSSIMGEIMMIGISSKDGTTSLGQLRTLSDWTIKPRLFNIPGLSQIINIGGEELQVQILVDADKLSKKQMSIQDLRENLGELSEASGGGFFVKDNKEFLIRNFGRILNHDEIPLTPIGLHLGRPILLKDVAEVKLSPAPKRGDASISGTPGVIMVLQKQPGTDTLELTKKVEETIKELQQNLPPDVQINTSIFKQSNFINAAIGNVKEALRDGTIMVALVLIIFLLNFRTTIITLAAIPLSLFITAIVFHLLGVGVNTMTLGGLAIAMGELVDDAIVDVENVFRRLKENKLSLNPKPILKVIYEASSEVRNSIVLATIIVVLVFIPLFYLSGIEGRLFTPIGIAYVVSLVASLLVSLTITPVMCFFLLKNFKFKTEKDSAIVTKLKNWDRILLEKTLSYPKKVFIFSGLLVVISASTIPFLGKNFLPPFNEGSAMLEIGGRPGISLDKSNEVAIAVEKALLTIPEVTSTGRRSGRANDDDHGGGVNLTEIEIALKDSDRSRAEIFNDLREKAQASVPTDFFTSITQPITHRLDYILSGVKSQVAIKIFGPDLRILRQQAAEIKIQFLELMEWLT